MMMDVEGNGKVWIARLVALSEFDRVVCEAVFADEHRARTQAQVWNIIACSEKTHEFERFEMQVEAMPFFA